MDKESEQFDQEMATVFRRVGTQDLSPDERRKIRGALISFMDMNPQRKRRQADRVGFLGWFYFLPPITKIIIGLIFLAIFVLTVIGLGQARR